MSLFNMLKIILTLLFHTETIIPSVPTGAMCHQHSDPASIFAGIEMEAVTFVVLAWG
jgi:hypothetical protein